MRVRSGRRRLNVWVPDPVHAALSDWVGRNDQTIQGTVRRLVEQEIGYEGPPEGDDVMRGRSDATPGAPVVSRTVAGDSEPFFAPAAKTIDEKPDTVRLTCEEADAQYLELRRKGCKEGAAKRSVGWAPVDWVPLEYEGDVPTPQSVARRENSRPHSSWTQMQQFEYWVRKGEMAQSAWERADGEGVAPEVPGDWRREI